jgi:8-oxo-dGTP pyrophosphatase MutT (NUDIX family)
MTSTSINAIRERAGLRLYTEPRFAPESSENSDHFIAGMNPDPDMITKARPAAVLVPIVARRDGPTLLLTRRPASMRQHSGQIAFPGGKIDRGDGGPLGAALREAEEEVGLARDAVTPLGFLAPYFSTTGYRITPVVAEIAPGAPLTLNPAEVQEAFEVPFAFLMDPANHRLDGREWQGAFRTYYAMPYGDHHIWGVTAGIIRMLWSRLYGP